MTKARLSESDLLSEESNEHLVVQHPVIIFIHSQPASQPPDRSVTARAGPSLRATPGASQARHAVSAPARLAEWNVPASSVLSVLSAPLQSPPPPPPLLSSQAHHSHLSSTHPVRLTCSSSPPTPTRTLSS